MVIQLVLKKKKVCKGFYKKFKESLKIFLGLGMPKNCCQVIMKEIRGWFCDDTVSSVVIDP